MRYKQLSGPRSYLNVWLKLVCLDQIWSHTENLKNEFDKIRDCTCPEILQSLCYNTKLYHLFLKNSTKSVFLD